MTKPTVTEPTILYGLFRRDALERTEDYVLRGETYTALPDANRALLQLQSELPAFLRNLIEVRVVEETGYRDDEQFGKNPLAYYTP